jgi:hypothetical protein
VPAWRRFYEAIAPVLGLEIRMHGDYARRWQTQPSRPRSSIAAAGVLVYRVR